MTRGYFDLSEDMIYNYEMGQNTGLISSTILSPVVLLLPSGHTEKNQLVLHVVTEFHSLSSS